MPTSTDDLAADLDHPDAQNLLRSAALARLAYAGRDGFPRVIPIGFHWDGRQPFVCTALTAPKVAALAARPNVALTIDTESTPAKALLNLCSSPSAGRGPRPRTGTCEVTASRPYARFRRDASARVPVRVRLLRTTSRRRA